MLIYYYIIIKYYINLINFYYYFKLLSKIIIMNIEDYEKKINMLYNYLNNAEFQDNYEIKKIDINKIKKDDIELPKGEHSNNILKYLLNQNIQHLFTINDDIYFKILSNNIHTLMKISINNNNLLLNDNLVSYVLSELVLTKKNNNILLPIVNININLLDLKSLLQTLNNIPVIYEKYLDKNKEKIISIKIRECFYNLTTLRNYINENNIDYKLLLFNIIIIIEQIKQTYTYFKHNNLTVDNIFVYTDKNIKSREILINKITYDLPNQSYELKITNFEYSQIINSNIKLLNDSNNIFEYKSNDNDLLLLIKDILKINKNIDYATKNFLFKLRDMKNNNIENLNDDFFSEYVKKTKSQNLKGRNKTDVIDKPKVLGDEAKYFSGVRKINLNNNFKLQSENESVLGDQRILRIDKHMKGGGEKETVAPYKKEQNNPFKTNDEKTTFTKKYDDINKPRVPPVLLEQTIYDTSMSKPQPQQPPPVYVPIYDQNNQQMAVPFVSNMINPALSQPYIKQYNVSLANPLHDFRTVSRVLEDVIPGDPKSFSFTTLYERKQLIIFIRNLLNNNTDGEDMIITGGKNSILSSIKLLDLNPYTVNKQPHLDLPNNFLLFRAAYPIRYDEEKNNVFISKVAHGINVRIYNMSIGEIVADEVNHNLSNFDFDLWRELKFYRHIFDHIIEKKISPNFISIILYKKDKLSNIKWDDLDIIQHKKRDNTIDNKLIAFKNNIDKNMDYDIIKILYINKMSDNAFDLIKSKLGIYPNLEIIYKDINDVNNYGLINKFNINVFPFILFKVNNQYIKYDGNIIVNDIIYFINTNIIKLDTVVNLKNSSGESLILLTEAPHSNIIKWTSPMYERNGALKKMIATGFHKYEVWESILFQIMHVLYILQEEEIYFEEISLENNIFIKDLYYDSNTLNYWIYIVDGLEYYVPNYGYLVLFDSKYSDLESGNFKIKSTKLFPNKNDKIQNANDADYNFKYKDEILKQFKNIFEPSIFLSKLKKQGGLEPDTLILDMLRNIYNDNILKGINEFIKKYFGKFLNNRVGKLLNAKEKEMINILSRPLYTRGELLVKQERYDEFKWVLFESNDSTNTFKQIINRDINNNIINENCNTFSLLSYFEKVKPYNIEENKIIETYRIV